MTASVDMLIGRKANGEKVYVQARLEYCTNELYRQTFDHHLTTERLRLAFGGTIVGKYGSFPHGRSVVAAGQTTDDLLEITELSAGWTIPDVVRLHEIWTAYHLNDMQAGCVHQSGRNPEPCMWTGYRYGSAWLFKPLPFDVFEFVCERFDVEPPEPGSVA